MSKRYLVLCLLLNYAFIFNRAHAQQALVSDAKKAELSSLSSQYGQQHQANQLRFKELASKYNWTTKKIRKNGSVLTLHSISKLGFPIYVRTDNNTTAAATTRTNFVQPGGSLNLNLSGSSTSLNNKLAIWDAGSVLGTHQEFAGKIITLKDASASIEEHSTHVAGTMIAKGVYAPAKGMSFGANTLLSYDFDNDVAEMSSAASNLLLSNHSYGAVAGWDYDDVNERWQWYGFAGDTVDYQFGYYDNQSQAWDKIAYTAPYYLIVESAGNNRSYNGPPVGQDYYGYRSRTDKTVIDKGARPANISNNDGYDIIPDFANAKNILTVGAVNPIPLGPTSRNDVSVAFFSSWGPTDDGRIKPDICGMGVNVLSTSNSSNTGYVTLSGTSMAAPNVTGSLYLLQEYYSQKHSGTFMKSATLKGLACHTAFDAGNVGPDYIYGWGLLDMQKAAQVITDNGSKSVIQESTLNNGQTQTINVVASGNGPLVASISWTDPAAVPDAEGTINNRTPKLINDLDIRISDGTNTYMPWVLDPNHPGLAATNGDNIRDNIEQIYIANAVPGRSYTITIKHKGTLSSGNQPFSLILTGVGGTNYCASAPASSADSRINNFKLSNINNTPAAGCTTYSDYTAQTIQLEPGKTYPLSLTLGTCGSNFNKIAKVFADWNGDGDFDDANELISTTTVINGTGTYTANITIPTDVTPGNYSRLRIVLTETTDPNAVLACGTYNKGETQDYRLQFIAPSVDAGITAINGSTAVGACAGKTNLTVTIRNYGSDTLTTVPLTVNVTAPDGTITTLNDTYNGIIMPGTQIDYTISPNYNTVAGSTYTLTGSTSVAGDLISSNNQITATLVIASQPNVSNLSAYYCTNSKVYLLNGTADGQLFWYKNATDTLPVAMGADATTTTAPVNNTFYAGVNDFDATVGPPTKRTFTGGSYDQFTRSVKVHAQVPLVIQSARLYIGNSGSITFSVTDSTGQIVSATTINAIATRTTPAEGTASDDPADQGKVYDLNLILPKEGTYLITATYDDNATIFRSNSGVTGYPFTAGNIFSITGNDATPDPQNFYYFFYNMHVHSYGCSSISRQAVSVTKPIITQNGNVLTSNYANSNQWYFNGKPVDGATGQTFSPTQSGDYQLGVNIISGCFLLSDTVHFALTALHPDNSTDIGLTIYPVPATDNLNVIFVARANSNVSFSFVNTAGQIVYTQNVTVDAGNYSTLLNTSGLVTGTYLLRVKIGDKLYTKKLIVVH